MLPEIRRDEGLYPVPQYEIEKVDITGFMDELREFHATFHDGFSRSEPRENFFRYMVGQLSDLERKSIEPIALHVEGGNPRRMQSAITDALWDEDKMLSKYHTLVHQDMGDPNRVLMYDESTFVKKGEDSVGVERQYCGTIGKVDNCQVGVFEGYASRHGYALVDKRLFIPESWFDAEHEEKRKKVNLPEGYAFKTKPQLAADMFEAIIQEGTLPFKYVVADHVYGDSPEFMNAVQSKMGIVYFVEVALSNLCWPGEGPGIETKTYRFRGEARSKKVVSEEEKKPMRLDALSQKIPDAFWYRRTVSEGTKGPITYEFTKRRVTLCKDGLPARTVWLVMKRSLDHTKCWFFISNAPLSTRLSTFVWLSGIRWAVEQCFEESKGEVGMDHYEVRKYPAWNRHILTSMLAHFFLWHLRIRLGKKSTAHYALAA